MKKMQIKLVFLFVGLVAISFASTILSSSEKVQADSILASVPSDSNLLISVDMQRAFELSLVQEALDDADATDTKELETLLEKHELTMEELCREFVFFGKIDPSMSSGGVWGAVMRTDIEEGSFKGILEAESNGEDAVLSYEIKDLQGYDVYVLNNDHAALTQGTRKMNITSAALTYITANHLLVADESEIERMITQITAGNTVERSPARGLNDIDHEALVWAIFDLNGNIIPQDLPPESEHFKDLAGGTFVLDFEGVADGDMDMRLSLESREQESAQKMHAQIRQFSGLIPMLFSGDPQLGNSVADSIDISLSGNKVIIAVSLQQSLIKDLQRFAESAQQEF